MPNKLKEILEELYDKGYLADNLPFVAERKMRIEKSFSQIQTWIEEHIGRDIDYVNDQWIWKDTKYNSNAVTFGYNTRGAEIRERLKIGTFPDKIYGYTLYELKQIIDYAKQHNFKPK